MLSGRSGQIESHVVECLATVSINPAVVAVAGICEALLEAPVLVGPRGHDASACLKRKDPAEAGSRDDDEYRQTIVFTDES
jgi:hypothetical protein